MFDFKLPGCDDFSLGPKADLDTQGFAIIKGVINPPDCRAIAAQFDQDDHFRSTIDMSRYGFGRGKYRYFKAPLAPELAELRTALYDLLLPCANAWQATLGLPLFPLSHVQFLELCHRAGQVRPTPLLLHYRDGDYNCLHQDIYGDLVFPIQAAILLDRPGIDFTGGEFVLTEQRPRRQSRASVAPLGQGDAVIFAVNSRPVMGTHGPYRVSMRHGVSTIHQGQRRTLGIILHDAR
jgi:hypothetical protein